ncbi:MAG: GTPase [Erysipelotrichaceae bacterium]
MSKQCIGCGVNLQYHDMKAVGYSPKQDALYCQRCFRLTNYGEFNVVVHNELNNEYVLSNAKAHKGTLLWVADLFDLESCLLNGLNHYFKDTNLVVVISKTDLLPITLTNKKIEDFVATRLKEYHIHVNGLITSGFSDSQADLWKQVKNQIGDPNIMVIGMANAGKSTLLNKLLDNKRLTASMYPNTTLSFNQFEKDGYQFIDTPGLSQDKSMLSAVDKEALKYLIPISRIKPRVYQIYENQSFAIGGLVRIDLETSSDASVVFYISNALNIHRGKMEQAASLWEKHYRHLLIPAAKQEVDEFKETRFIMKDEPQDIVLFGLGWIRISGKVKTVSVYAPSNVECVERKAMI